MPCGLRTAPFPNATGAPLRACLKNSDRLSAGTRRWRCRVGGQRRLGVEGLSRQWAQSVAQGHRGGHGSRNHRTAGRGCTACADHAGGQPRAVSHPSGREHGRTDQNWKQPLPADPRQPESDEIEGAFSTTGEWRRGRILLRLSQLRLQLGHDPSNVEPQFFGIGPCETTNVHLSSEGIPVARLERADVVGLDVGHVGHIVDGTSLTLTLGLQLISNTGHGPLIPFGPDPPQPSKQANHGYGVWLFQRFSGKPRPVRLPA